MIQHKITLKGEAAKGARISLPTLGTLSQVLTNASQRVLRLRVESRSNLQSKPAWLDAATDIELVGLERVGLERGSTVLVFEVPTLEEAAPAIFEQLALWETGPRRQQSALSLVEETLRDAAAGNTESDLLDRNTLGSVVDFRDFLHIGYNSFSLDGSAEDAPLVQVTSAILNRVELLRNEAPPPQRVIVTGTLDEPSVKKRTFRLLLPQGQSIRGILPPGEYKAFRGMLGETVVVDGEASFRLSGRLSFLAATNIQIATEQDKVFAHLPRPRPRSLEEVQPRLLPPAGTSGMSGVFGRWPGTETEAELLAALEEMS